ncbi:MAG TPA: HNH endonuclease signature motif containing protein [Steroidobacteraceae bacterium]|nr:HNH endonuclease signature motif containing protein [Steroidobacteraceae bacterium]
MPTNPLDRLMWAQGNRCFFCDQQLPRDDASVEHLWAKANGGTNSDENCVACCKAVNALFGSMSLKEKFQVVLNQQGKFNCPSDRAATAAKSKAPQKSISKEPAKDLYRSVVDGLTKQREHAPKTVKALTSAVKVLLGASHKGTTASQIIQQMQAVGFASVSGTKVTYDFSRAEAKPK